MKTKIDRVNEYSPKALNQLGENIILLNEKKLDRAEAEAMQKDIVDVARKNDKSIEDVQSKIYDLDRFNDAIVSRFRARINQEFISDLITAGINLSNFLKEKFSSQLWQMSEGDKCNFLEKMADCLGSSRWNDLKNHVSAPRVYLDNAARALLSKMADDFYTELEKKEQTAETEKRG